LSNAHEIAAAGQRYLRLIKFELIRLYEIQHSLQSLSYFDVYGRLRLTLALTRVTLEIPMVLDRAMRDELPAPVNSNTTAAANGRSDTTRPEGSRQRAGGSGNQRAPPTTPPSESGSPGQLERRGLLGVKTRGMLVLTCKMLERAERWAGPGSSAAGAAGAAATAPPSQTAAAAQ
jgi:hypothetical protein